jgi:hypothetical protein
MLVSSNETSLITLSFTTFSTQAFKDFVVVLQCTDAICSQQQQLAKLSGTYTDTQVLTSATGYMKVVFTSDGSINYAGFNASWNIVSFPFSLCLQLIPVFPDSGLFFSLVAGKLYMHWMWVGMWADQECFWNTV